MCLICIEYEKGKLLPLEGLRNLEEMKSTPEEEHYYDVYCKLYDDFLEQQDEQEYYESVGFGD
jgi:hypothetical protein